MIEVRLSDDHNTRKKTIIHPWFPAFDKDGVPEGPKLGPELQPHLAAWCAHNFGYVPPIREINIKEGLRIDLPSGLTKVVPPENYYVIVFQNTKDATLFKTFYL